jgi:hypothetical protein
MQVIRVERDAGRAAKGFPRAATARTCAAVLDCSIAASCVGFVSADGAGILGQVALVIAEDGVAAEQNRDCRERQYAMQLSHIQQCRPRVLRTKFEIRAVTSE